MNINSSEKIKEDLTEFWDWIKEKDSVWFQQNQEQVLTLLALLINNSFRTKIDRLRKELKIPKDWYTTKKNEDLYAEYLNYIKTNPKEALTLPHDKRITDICKELKIDVKRYYDFIVDYLNYGHARVLITPHYEYFEHYYADNEYRYKANIELDYGEARQEKLSETPVRAYIQFYKDTTPNQLVEFITKNSAKIAKIQKELTVYPHEKKYEHFKRDVQVYIFYLLEENPLDIPKILISKNVPDEESEKTTALLKEYAISDPQVHLIIGDIKQRIEEIFK